MENYRRKQRNGGITLIALIITVIVMLILAGVTINLTVGDNGIFKKSDEGAKIYQNVANNETASLNGVEQEMGDLINKYYGGTTTEQPNPTEEPIPIPTTEPSPSPTIPVENPGKPDASGIYTENSTINGGEASAFNPEIPKGFKPVDVENAEWGDGNTPPTQDSVKKGLVIEDEEHNQFVWIAVDGIDVVLGRYVYSSLGEINKEYSKTEPDGQVVDSSFNLEKGYYYTEGLKDETRVNTVAKDINGFRASVTKYGGYYIARYEASYGIDGKPNSKISTGFTTQSGVAYAPKVEGRLWNNITQPEAAIASRSMYDGSYGITSDLVNSYAWDTAIMFIMNYSDDSKYSAQHSLNSELDNTGENGDEKCHIQDMGSNCCEWSTETFRYSGKSAVYRGSNIFGNTTSTRAGDAPGTCVKTLGFRVVLYL